MDTERRKRMAAPAFVLAALWIASLACGPTRSSTAMPAGSQNSGSGSQGAGGGGLGAGEAVNTLEDVKKATLQIQAEGGLVQPGQGTVDAGWFGSGFFIDPSGIAVTNNHVVTGAALLKVRIGGEGDWQTARVLGVSECSDLAVIQVSGSGYPYLQWRSGPINVGLDMYVAGFPLGNPEYTMVRGIVSKEKADGETSWTSVESVIEYDAATNPGSSGGPAIDANGNVIAVNYAGNKQTAQAFGIARDAAQPVIDQLRKGIDVDAIGVNGQAFVTDDGSMAGIWVQSVASGSVADKAGVKGGDIIVSIEGVQLAKNGTMGEYCDILRSHTPTDPLAIKVIRFDTGEVLEGQLNGRELAASGFFGTQAGGSQPGTTTTTGGGYSGYTLVQDDYKSIQIAIPNEWSQVDGSPWIDGGDTIGASIWASPDLQQFQSTWSQPGVIFNVSDDLARLGGYIQVLDIYRQDYIKVCELAGRYDYTDVAFRGKYDLYQKCGGSGGPQELVLTAVPKSNAQAYIIVVAVTITSDADLDALDHILQTFDIVGQLP
jgi:serine protease Do